MSALTACLCVVAICLAVSVVALCGMLLGAYQALSDMDDELAQTRQRLDDALVIKRVRADVVTMPFWGVRRGS